MEDIRRCVTYCSIARIVRDEVYGYYLDNENQDSIMRSPTGRGHKSIEFEGRDQ